MSCQDCMKIMLHDGYCLAYFSGVSWGFGADVGWGVIVFSFPRASGGMADALASGASVLYGRGGSSPPSPTVMIPGNIDSVSVSGDSALCGLLSLCFRSAWCFAVRGAFVASHTKYDFSNRIPC